MDKAATTKGDWVATGEDKSILASMRQVKVGLRNGSDQFIDARPTAQFLSIVKAPVDKAAGHRNPGQPEHQVLRRFDD